MSRRLPLCAWCGEPLQGTTMELQYDRLPGRPAVGWHVDTCDVAETANYGCVRAARPYWRGAAS